VTYNISVINQSVKHSSLHDLEISFHPYWLFSKCTRTSICVNKKCSPIVTSPPAPLPSDRMYRT